MIIGICGFIGSGKDTAADYLVNFHEFQRESFAATLKDAVASVFGWNRELLEGRTKHSREWREQRDDWWSHRLDMHITPRWILQNWGTNVLRQHFHDDIWIASLENKLRQSQNNIVISDCRFPNEILALRRQGGQVIWIQRGHLPVWYENAVLANQGDIYANEYLVENNIHPSETSWVGTKFDHIVDNNGSIESLYNQLKNLV
jgi:rhodanese-related sulfurtransferase